ncbi:MAG: ABC transporter ATP-binding protein [Nitrososphaerota archaeon]|nr:ABC transporter ATP-binding protein [Candidatus Bathyarchaeota archaeon]MDW8048183.1 ABC transporter ATP-binding protein [Nitrososphaerota archaeon]
MEDNILEIRGLTVQVQDRTILEDVDLNIPRGEVHVIFGPNGSGKSTLIMAILGFPAYKITSGRIFFEGKDITNIPVNERVKLGISVAFQNPPAIRGVKLGGIIRHLRGGQPGMDDLLEKVKLPPEFLERDINLGFSGGEIKKSELLQILAQEGKFVILDEPDSGVDVENLQIVGKLIGNLLKDRSGLIITHLGHVLRYVDVDKAHVLVDKRIACSGEPLKILGQILNEGYSWCMKCPKIKRMFQEKEISQQN